MSLKKHIMPMRFTAQRFLIMSYLVWAKLNELVFNQNTGFLRRSNPVGGGEGKKKNSGEIVEYK